MLCYVTLALALASSPAAKAPSPKAVVSFELEDVFWDAAGVRSGAREELQKWLRERFSGYETEALDVYEQFDALQVAGSEFGYMLPGVIEVMRETIKLATAPANLEEEPHKALINEALAEWLQAHDTWAESLLASDSLPALDALRDRGVAICAITNSVGSTARMPSLAPYFDFTMCTYDFMVPAEEGWDVAFQVARLGKYAPGTPWIHVCGATEGGLSKVASIDGVRTIGIGASSSYDDAAVLYLEDPKFHCTTIQNVTRTTHTHENTIQSRPFISAYTTTPTGRHSLSTKENTHRYRMLLSRMRCAVLRTPLTARADHLLPPCTRRFFVCACACSALSHPSQPPHLPSGRRKKISLAPLCSAIVVMCVTRRQPHQNRRLPPCRLARASPPLYEATALFAW